MNFRTIIDIPKAKFLLSPQKPVILLGSCFSDNIGQRLSDSMWDTAVNPCGVLYNPASIATIISRAIENTPFDEIEIFENDNRYFSWLFDTHFSSYDKEITLKNINSAISSTSDYLRSSSCLIITFGTAWIYQLCDTDMIVGNCHKMPNDKFKRRKMNVEEITNLWIDLIHRLQRFNPDLNIIFTVSPIRHIKDGIHENTLSKATLMLAIDNIISKTIDTDYFPAYELVIDELRDYRFYADDMMHPSKLAIDYIWQRFSEKYFSEQTISILKQGTKLTQRLKHRYITDDKNKIEKFNSETERLISEFIATHPYLHKP